VALALVCPGLTPLCRPTRRQFQGKVESRSISTKHRRTAMVEQEGRTRPAAMDLLIAKASGDPAFRSQLLSDSPAALATAGLKAPPGVTVKVVEDSHTLVHLVLPPEALSDADLATVAGGATLASGGWNAIWDVSIR